MKKAPTFALFLQKLLFSFVFAVTFLLSTPSFATVVTFSTFESRFDPFALNQGWWNTFGSANANDAYSTGEFSNQSFRSFFTFDLSSLAGTVTEATLRVMRGLGSTLFEEVQLSLWDVTTPADILNHNEGINMDIIEDLGSGVTYGSYSIPSGDYYDYLLLPLNSDALSQINATKDYFSIGAMGGALEQSMFGGTGSSVDFYNNFYDARITYLDLTVEPTASVSEPTTSVLLGLGILCFAVTSRRNRRSKTMCRSLTPN